MRRTLIALAVLLGSVFGAGCNTMEGLGRDIEKAGDKLENAAKKAK
jgi:predicted small secreted protein